MASKKESNGLDGTSFSSAIAAQRKRIVWECTGKEKSGKTHLGFQMPGPIAYQYTDFRHEGVVQKFDKKILMAEYKVNLPEAGDEKGGSDEVRDEFTVLWDLIVADYLAALRSPLSTVRSVVWDTGTEMLQILRLAKLGKLTQVKPHHYGPVNAEWARVIREAYNYDKNFLILHKARKQYASSMNAKGEMVDAWNGKWERNGYTDMGFLVQACTRIDFDPKTHQSVLEVTECGLNRMAVGEKIKDPSFLDVVNLVVEDPNPRDWK